MRNARAAAAHAAAPGAEPGRLRSATRSGWGYHPDRQRRADFLRELRPLLLRWRDPQLAHAGPGAKQFSLDDIWHPRPLIANESGHGTLAARGGRCGARRHSRLSPADHRHLFAIAEPARVPFDRDTFRCRSSRSATGPRKCSSRPTNRPSLPGCATASGSRSD